jgi:8-oxo-dGTP diphosphatase
MLLRVAAFGQTGWRGCLVHDTLRWFWSASLSMAEVQFFVGVHGVIANRGRLLVLKRSELLNYCPGVWDLPGGHLSLGESAEEGLRREIREEASLDVAVERLLGLHNMIHEPYMQALYACRLTVYRSLRLQPDEHLEARWVTPAELEELELIPYLERVLKRGMLAYVR